MDSQLKTKSLKGLYVIFFLITLSLIAWPARGGFGKGTYYLIGKILGGFALTSLVLQPVLASRFKPLEKGVGLDQLMRWHHWNARFLVIAALLHPLLLYSKPLLDGASLKILLLSLIPLTWFWLGIATLLLIFLTILLAIYAEQLNLQYEDWKRIHRVGYLIVALGFAHSFAAGSDLALRGPFFYWWAFLLALGLGAVFYRWGVYPLRTRKNIYRVTKIVPESHNVRSIWLEPLYKPLFNYQAGQFVFVTFLSKNLPKEEHHFTISSAPSRRKLRLTIKESGDFTAQLSKLSLADTAKIDGPYGSFTLDRAKKQDQLLFIAGGIGITPIISMLEEMRAKECLPTNTVLIYANRTHRDIIFLKQLNELQTQGKLKVVHVLSQEKHQSYHYGYVDSNLLEREVANLVEREVFLVGPPPMMQSVKNALVYLGIPTKQIHTEEFSLR